MTELEAADIINRSESLRCLNCKYDIPNALYYWMLTPFPNPFGFYTYVNANRIINIAEQLQQEETKTP